MTFGWEGFSLEHPEDWAPATLSGHRQEGYARVVSPDRLGIQIRWKAAKLNVGLKTALDSYLARLRNDAKKADVPFTSDIDQDGSQWTYRYHGVAHGRGALFFSKACGRLFFLELFSTHRDSLQTPFRQTLESFRSFGDDRNELWSVLGLHFLAPRGLIVERKDFQAGLIRLHMNVKGVHLRAERWGFAQQLVAQHGLEAWSRAVLELPKCPVETSAAGLRFVRNAFWPQSPVEALVKTEPDSNQILTLRVSTRRAEWSPQWNWLAEPEVGQLRQKEGVENASIG